MASNTTRVGARRTFAAGVVFLAALTVAACGSSEKTVTAASYVSQVCTSIGTWVHAVEADATQLKSEATRFRDLGQAKVALESLFNSTISETQKAVAGLKAAGVPHVSGGKQIAKEVVSALELVKEHLVTARGELSALSTKSSATAQRQLSSLGGALESSLSNIGSSLSGLHSPALAQAAGQSPACQALTGASAS